MTDIKLRLRGPAGTKTFQIPATSTFYDLRMKIQELTRILCERQILRIGFPPKEITAETTQLLSNLGITAGETVVVDERPVNAVMNTIETTEQIPDSDGKVMVRRIIPADNSCLFNSVAYALDGRQYNLGGPLREVIVAFVISDPEFYNEIYLEKRPEEYTEWIMKETSWGGAIELSILSKYYTVQIAAVNIQNLRVDVYGEEEGFDNRIYVIYDGIHYDILARNLSGGTAEESDATVFHPNDDTALQGALVLAEQLRKAKQFTDTSKFSLVCGVCYQGLVGQSEAVEHCRQTGHTNFQEAH